MPEPTDLTPGTPQWWLRRLHKALADRQAKIAMYDAYYLGRHRMAFATTKFRDAFGNLFAAFADNWCDLVVDASVERLEVTGFRFGNEGREGDDAAWRIWQSNNLDADSLLAHTEAVKHGEAFVLVSPSNGEVPTITVEHPAQCVVAYDPGNLRRRAAGLKEWRETDDRLMATLYLPDTVYRLRSRQPVRSSQPAEQIEWETREEPVRNPMRVVPLVPLRNNPALLGGGRSDIAPVIPLQDAVNKIVADMIVASEFTAFRQRWATGIELPLDPVTGEPMREVFDAAVNRLWTVGDPEAKFGEFSATDLGNYVAAIEMLVQHVAAQTRTPPHYLLGQSGAFPSGESLKSTETGLVAKVRRKQVAFAEGWEDAIRLAFRLMNDTERAGMVGAETLWRDPESRTESEHVDAVLKMAAAGVPQQFLWERLGFSPQDIARMQQMQAAEALRLDALAFGAPTDQGVEHDAGVAA